jgi:hypothetical protein
MKAHNPNDVVKFFGGVRKTQEAYGLRSRQSVYYWLKRGRMPELMARKGVELSRGKLKFDHSEYHTG